jgi:thiaminase/transcriptional activator TenA
MSPFHETLLRDNAELLGRARTHPLMIQIANGTLPEDRFLAWVSQNYVWVRDFERFLANLSSRAPRVLGKAFCEALLNLHGEIELYEEICARTPADVKSARHSYHSSASSNLLLATVLVRSFEEALTACYAYQTAFREAWVHAQQQQKQQGPWQDFVSLFAAKGFSLWVERLAGFVDVIAEQTSEAQRNLMSEIFPMGIHYNLRYWDGVLQGSEW